MKGEIKRPGAGILCSGDKCEHYAGANVGYCRTFKVIMRTEEEKEYFASHCAHDPGEKERMDIALKYLYDVKKGEG